MARVQLYFVIPAASYHFVGSPPGYCKVRYITAHYQTETRSYCMLQLLDQGMPNIIVN